MSSQSEPTRISIIWSPKARADLRSIIRETAMDILKCVDQYRVSRSGDVKKLKPPLVGFRLRCGDYRVFFDQRGNQSLEITEVRNRRDAYR